MAIGTPSLSLASRMRLAVFTTAASINGRGSKSCTILPSVPWKQRWSLWNAEVKRASRILLRAWAPDETELAIEAEGLLAIALQHELDHLDGKLFIDRLSRLKRDLYRARQRKLDRQGRPASSGRTPPLI